jgi:hypothetical protein
VRDVERFHRQKWKYVGGIVSLAARRRRTAESPVETPAGPTERPLELPA